MSKGRSKDEFLAFLDWVSAKGLLPLNTAQARKAVANKVLAALEPDELADLTVLNIDDVMVRFSNKFGKRYTPDSLRTYRSRFESSLSDFRAYCNDPVGFRPAGRMGKRKRTSENGEEKSPSTPGKRQSRAKPDGPSNHPSNVETVTTEPGNVIPVQIRPDLTIRIGPVPYDLTAAEARRIANVIIALAIADV